MTTKRKIKELIKPQMVREGADVLLMRSFFPQASNRYDPFLLFDHFAFNDPNQGPLQGFPEHPHRGIETVTYMLKGLVRHGDSMGNKGVIGPGDVQWMTAGGGILHEELPGRDGDGQIYGFQLWVNLPAALKMSRPNYQEVAAQDIPSYTRPGITVRVVAGESGGITGPVKQIAARPLYLEAALEPGVTFNQPVTEGHTVLVYVFEGQGEIGGELVEALSMAVMDDGEVVEIRTGSSAMRIMLMAGAPFNEPVAPYGPFVMNTREEILQALADLRSGTFVKS